MVFSDADEHKILIKKLHQLKGYNVRQLRTEFPHKGWTRSINRLLKSPETWAQWTDVRAATDCEVPARMITIVINLNLNLNLNIDQVNDMVLSQEDQPRTHITVREISRKTGIPIS